MCRVMLIDNHPVALRGLRELLKSISGVEFCGAALDETSALLLAQRLSPEMVICEAALPETNGIQMISRIVRAAPNTDILVLSSEESIEIVRRTLRAGARGYALKRDSVSEISEGINTVRQHQVFISGQLKTEVKPAGPLLPSPDKLLTARELAIVKMLASGHPNKQIGINLGISRRTVESHRSHLMHKLKFDSLSQLVRFAIRNEMVEL
jgi:DNA-binding NarL/FixJ family response regulator